MKVQEAIRTVEILGGYEFIGRCHTVNEKLRITGTQYIFDGVEFASIGQLRFYAEQFNYTHGVNR